MKITGRVSSFTATVVNGSIGLAHVLRFLKNLHVCVYVRVCVGILLTQSPETAITYTIHHTTPLQAHLGVDVVVAEH